MLRDFSFFMHRNIIGKYDMAGVEGAPCHFQVSLWPTPTDGH